MLPNQGCTQGNSSIPSSSLVFASRLFKQFPGSGFNYGSRQKNHFITHYYSTDKTNILAAFGKFLHDVILCWSQLMKRTFKLYYFFADVVKCRFTEDWYSPRLHLLCANYTLLFRASISTSEGTPDHLFSTKLLTQNWMFKTKVKQIVHSKPLPLQLHNLTIALAKFKEGIHRNCAKSKVSKIIARENCWHTPISVDTFNSLLHKCKEHRITPVTMWWTPSMTHIVHIANSAAGHCMIWRRTPMMLTNLSMMWLHDSHWWLGWLM